jgi:hypothetical protein
VRAEGVEGLSDRAYCVGCSTVHSGITCSGFDARLDRPLQGGSPPPTCR